MKAPTALVGHTGLVGQTLSRLISFDAAYNSENSFEMAGKHFSTVFFCAARAEKWKANAKPDEDLEHIQKLIQLLHSFTANRIVLISTVDVFSVPISVDEKSPLVTTGIAEPYGANRLKLEEAVNALNCSKTIIRLPALFGKGLKKNAIFDLIHDNQVNRINPNNCFQFFNLANIQKDVSKVIELNIPAINIISEPIRIGDIAKKIFDRDIEYNVGGQETKYDVRSLYASEWGGVEYQYSSEQIFEDLKTFALSSKKYR